MPVALLVIGVLMIVVAFQNTMGQFARELEADIPGYFVWLVAIVVLLGLGYVPQLRTPSRWLLGLVALIVLLTNYKQIVAGFTTFAGSGGSSSGSTAADPTAAYASSPAAPLPTAAQVGGDASSGGGAAGASSSSSSSGGAADQVVGQVAAQAVGAVSGVAQTAVSDVLSYANPSSYVGAFSSSIGFGGLA